jgi:hypothetical protein
LVSPRILVIMDHDRPAETTREQSIRRTLHYRWKF